MIKFFHPDGETLSETFEFTTTRAHRFFHGKLPPNTVDVHISIRGTDFISAIPDLVYIAPDQVSFTLPNPETYGDGLQLFAGENIIQVKPVLSNGQVLAPSTITAHLSLDADIVLPLQTPPEDISVERFNDYVVLSVVDKGVGAKGYHFYASTMRDGEEYRRINSELITTYSTQEVVQEVGSLDYEAAQNDSTYSVQFQAGQLDIQGNPLVLDIASEISIPSTSYPVHLRGNFVLESVYKTKVHSFKHDRKAGVNQGTIPNGEFNAIPASDPLYYVATAVYVDSQGVEHESPFSPEISAAPFTLTPNISSLPSVSRQKIVQDLTLSIFRTHPHIDIKPGSVIRDTFIDPFSNEAERFRFLISFFQDAQSFATLLPVDEAPVSSNPYKQALKLALYLSNDSQVQQVFDDAFDRLASNFGIYRKPGRRSRGTVSVRGTVGQEIDYPHGFQVTLGGVEFTFTSPVRLTAANRYTAAGFIQAVRPGTEGNISIFNKVTLPGGVVVENDTATFGGTETETNKQLATRAMARLAGVDSGTRQGYFAKAIDVPGVTDAFIAAAGDPLMVRDNGLGGKVDVWIRSDFAFGNVTEHFALRYETANNILFNIVGLKSNLTFKAQDPNLSPENPIVQLLHYPARNHAFRNVSKAYNFDLTDYQIIDYDTIRLSANHNNPNVMDLTDVISGAFRYRTSEKYVFQRQPVHNVINLTGQMTGLQEVDLYKIQDPLLLGASSAAQDYIQVVDSNSTVEVLSVVGEPHNAPNTVETLWLNMLGVVPVTVEVFTANRTTQFAEGVDYLLVNEGGRVGIRQNGNMVEGTALVVDYDHDENFTVVYTPNSTIGVVAQSIEESRHLTADVVVKETYPTFVDISATLILRRGAVTIEEVNRKTRTALENYFLGLSLNDPIRPSDIIRLLDEVEGVSYVVTPLTQMAKAKGSYVLREQLPADDAVFKIDTWQNAYLVTTPLQSPTSHGGGPSTIFKGVHTANNTLLRNVTVKPNLQGTSLTLESAFIIGEEGMVIPGYSDDESIEINFPYKYPTPELIAQKRKEITQNRIIVCTEKVSREYFVTYVVSSSKASGAVYPGPTSFLKVGEVNLVFDQDRH